MSAEKDKTKTDAFFKSLNYQWVGEHDEKMIERIEKFLK
jgi:hypothetical protein